MSWSEINHCLAKCLWSHLTCTSLMTSFTVSIFKVKFKFCLHFFSSFSPNVKQSANRSSGIYALTTNQQQLNRPLISSFSTINVISHWDMGKWNSWSPCAIHCPHGHHSSIHSTKEVWAESAYYQAIYDNSNVFLFIHRAIWSFSTKHTHLTF